MTDNLGPCPEIYTTIRTKMINEEYVAWLEFALEEAMRYAEHTRTDCNKVYRDCRCGLDALREDIKTMEGK